MDRGSSDSEIAPGERERSHIYGFNALRAFSVGLVILSHIEVIKHAHHPLAIKFFTVFNASYGVKTFFVLSGFLITSLLIAEHKKYGRVNVLNFMARRALRILPLYFLILFIIVALTLARIARPAPEAMAFSTFFVFNFLPKDAGVNYLSHLWSLAVEEQYYLLWPLTFSLFFRSKAVLIGTLIAVLILCYLTYGWDFGGAAKSFSTNRWTIPAIYPIAIGSLAALVTKQLTGILKSDIMLVAACVAIALPLFFSINATLEMVTTFGIAGVIAWIYFNQHRKAVRWLDWGPIGYAGMISYGLYMWQGILTGNGPYRDAPHFPPSPLVGALLTLVVAQLSFHYFETPILRLKKRFPAKPSTGTRSTPESRAVAEET